MTGTVGRLEDQVDLNMNVGGHWFVGVEFWLRVGFRLDSTLLDVCEGGFRRDIGIFGQISERVGGVVVA